MARTTRKNRYSISGTTAVLEVLSPVDDMKELTDRMETEAVVALVFVNDSAKMQYLFAPSVLYGDDGLPSRILGNACDSSDNFRPTEVSR